MFAKRWVQMLSGIMVVALLTSAVQRSSAQEPDGPCECGPYISGGPDNPTTGELVTTAVVDGILLGLYIMDGDHFIWVRCDTYQQVGEAIPI